MTKILENSGLEKLYNGAVSGTVFVLIDVKVSFWKNKRLKHESAS